MHSASVRGAMSVTRRMKHSNSPVGDDSNTIHQDGVTAKLEVTTGRSGVRVFKHVESMTNQLVATDKNFQAVYDATMIQLVLFVFYVVIRDSIKAGRLHFDVSMLYIGLGSGPVALVLECYLLTSFLLVYPLFKVWKLIYNSSIPTNLGGCVFIVLFVSYVVSSGIIVCWSSLSLPLPHFITIIVSVEQLRLCMKSYSFIRENAYKVLYPWHKDDDFGPAVWYAGQMSPQVGSFSHYLYFMFAPTLLYRDHYPRNEGPIQWKNVVIYFIQFIATIWYLGFIAKDFTFPSSLRKWNTIVHDWIHSYLYTDMKSIFQSPLLAVFATIFVSAFVHEYLLALALRFASPVLLMEFAGLGVLFYLMEPFKKRRISNLFFLFCLSVGGANLVFYYQVELAARLYCPRELNWVTFFKPRLFECYSSYNYSSHSSQECLAI